MNSYKKEGLLLVKSWCVDVETKAQEQIDNLCALPFAFHHVAVMPDCHMGYGMPIGGVLATKHAIIPNAVGVDIGCGMCACDTGIKIEEVTTDMLKKVMGTLRQEIPVGFNKNKAMCSNDKMPHNDSHQDVLIVDREYDNARLSLGTLGGGNHFIEFQKGKRSDSLWVMIHSGSRNLGKQVAEHYNNLAVMMNELYYSSVPKKHELAFLPVASDDFDDYVAEMNYCVEFALANRKEMMNKILDVVSWNSGSSVSKDIINIAHNYVRLENHFGENVWVHRKGATHVTKNITGIIPGSQGSKSYIVKGKDNADSYFSCSHGAGRKMGRKDAVRNLDLEVQKKLLDDAGIIHAIRNKDDLEEAPGAYKDIDAVMAAQSDLVEIIEELSPLAVIKG